MHWHLSDDQTFSIDFDSKNTHRMYSLNDVKSIVDAGRLRGIQIIPEIDSPSHAKAIGLLKPGKYFIFYVFFYTLSFISSLSLSLLRTVSSLFKQRCCTT